MRSSGDQRSRCGDRARGPLAPTGRLRGTVPRAQTGGAVDLVGIPGPGDLRGEGLGLGIGCDAELALEDLCATLVLAQRLTSPPRPRIGTHQGALAEFGEWIKRYQPAPGVDRGLRLALLGGGSQPLQDIADHSKRTVAFACQPFLKRFRIDMEIGKEFATV